MDHIKVKQLIEQGENSAIEFKTDEIKPDSLAIEMIAFANTEGGTILLGIADNSEIRGLKSEKNWEEWVMNIARNNIQPPLNVDYISVEIENKNVGCITIPKGKFKPYQTLNGKYYIRIGSTNRIVSVTELMRLFQESGLFHYDAVGVEKTSERSLNLTKIHEYFSHYDIDFESEDSEQKVQLLKNSDIHTEEGLATLGGLLVFGIVPDRYLFQSGIIFAHFNGVEITSELIDRQEINGTLDYLINTSTAVIKNNIAIASDIEGNKRVDRFELYPDKVYRELITNACVHRNYAIHGSKIRIFMFQDRLEIISPGKVPNSVTLEKILAGVSYARNPIIAKFMTNLRFIDIMGRGIPFVVGQARQLGKKIKFEEIGEEFKVTLFL